MGTPYAPSSPYRSHKTMRMKRARLCQYLIGLLCGFFVGGLYFSWSNHLPTWNVVLDPLGNTTSDLALIDRNSPFIFIGGWPRSGTTLMRVLLDVHPLVRCGPETRVIPRVLQLYRRWTTSNKEKERLKEAGVLGDALDSAVSSFVMEIIRRHSTPGKYLCNKDPMTFKYLDELSSFFPNARFILMLRDGRAVANSIIKRRVVITNLKFSDPWSNLEAWNSQVTRMYDSCLSLGSRCMPLKYENLVLQPRRWLRRVLDFLGIPWDEILLNHWSIVGKKEGVHLSQKEKSSNQVVFPINLNALTAWTRDGMADDFVYGAHMKAPLLKALGYDVSRIPPYYGDPDPLVVNMTMALNQSAEFNKVFGAVGEDMGELL